MVFILPPDGDFYTEERRARLRRLQRPRLRDRLIELALFIAVVAVCIVAAWLQAGGAR